MKRTAQELANHIGARVEGDAALELLGSPRPSVLSARPDLHRLAEERSVCEANRTPICVIALDGVESSGKTVLRHPQPKVAFAKAAAFLLDTAMIASPGIHPTAVVPTTAKIARIREHRAVRRDRRKRRTSAKIRRSVRTAASPQVAASARTAGFIRVSRCTRTFASATA